MAAAAAVVDYVMLYQWLLARAGSKKRPSNRPKSASGQKQVLEQNSVCCHGLFI